MAERDPKEAKPRTRRPATESDRERALRSACALEGLKVVKVQVAPPYPPDASTQGAGE